MAETDVLGGDTVQGITLIEDSPICRSLPLLKCIVLKWKQKRNLLVRFTKLSPQLLLMGQDEKNITIIPSESPNDLFDLKELSKHLEAAATENCAVIVDNLMPFIYNAESLSFVMGQLLLIENTIKCPVISVVDGSQLNTKEMDQLRHICNRWIQLLPIASSPNSCLCRVQGTKQSGKPYEKLYRLEVTAEFDAIVTLYEAPPTQLTSTMISIPLAAVPATKEIRPEEKPKAPTGLTFNLTLTDAEVDMRAKNLKLPYMEVQKRGKETLPTAQILYVAEEADDIDEEDPDDDLDI